MSEAATLAPLPTGDSLRALIGAEREATLERIVCRLGQGKHACPDAARLTHAEGLVGDRWAAFRPERDRQITVMDVRVVRLLLAYAAAQRGAQLELIEGVPSELDRPGDNLVIDLPTSMASLPGGTRIRVGEVLLETNDVPHLGCKKFEERFGADALAWVNDMAHRDLRLRGIHAHVIEDGDVKVGDAIRIVADAP